MKRLTIALRGDSLPQVRRFGLPEIMSLMGRAKVLRDKLQGISFAGTIEGPEESVNVIEGLLDSVGVPFESTQIIEADHDDA